MGCELCNNAKTQKEEASLTRQANLPVLKKSEPITISNNNSSIIDAYRISLEEKLNAKYLSPFKSEKTTIDSKGNKNIFNYTQNIVNNNNIIKYDTRNRLTKEKEKEVISSILKEKGDFVSLEINYNFNSKGNENSNRLNSESINLPEITNINNNDKYINENNNKNEIDKINNYTQKNNYINEKEKDKEEEDEDEEDEEEEEEEDSKHNDENNNNVEINQMKKNIESLLKQINYSKIDKILDQTPEREETSLSQLIKYFQKKSKNSSEIEKAYLIYKWITLNIEYDFAGVNDKNYDVSAEATFNRGKSICEGYSNLFNKISSDLNLIVEKILGHSKGFNFELTDKFEESETHAWNAIQINKVWYFIETTWGAGYSEDHKNFIKKFTSYYFLTPPIQFIRGHFPEEAKWQLLPKKEIIDQKKFMEFVDLKSTFFELGFESIEPDLTFNHVKEKGNFKILFNKNNVNVDKIKMMAKLELIQNKNTLREIENSTLVIKNKNFFEINYIINNKGKYKLQIFGASIEEEKYSELCSLILISKKDSTSNLSFPKTYKLYNNSDMQIISPKNGVLYNGDTIDFEYKTNIYKNLYIIISDKENNNFISMDRQGNIFKENEVLIYGQQVKISTKNPKSDLYDTIIEYTVQKNPNKNYNISFPKTYSGPKNRLINPICNALKKGQKVNFKIKSSHIAKMVVFDGNKSHDLKKQNDLFEGNFVIKANKNSSVKIGYSKDGNTFGVLYEYNVT